MKVTVKIEIENIEKVSYAIDEVVKRAGELRAGVQRLDEVVLDIKTSSY